MTTRSRRFVFPGLLVLPAIGLFVGGWAVTTVEDLPDYLVARRPVNLTFTVRQHGMTLLSGLSARVVARAGALEATAAATPGRERGQYTATLTLPEPGDWTITIHNGFRGEVVLLPVQAIEAGTRPPPSLSESERGRRLFVAKGCVTCHVHSEIEGSGVVAVGPDLSGRRYPAAYLQQFLANPAIAAASLRGGTGKMPNLNLKQPEIAALTSFLNAEGQPARSLR